MKIVFDVIKKEGISSKTNKPYCMYILRSRFGDIVLNTRDRTGAIISFLYDNQNAERKE